MLWAKFIEILLVVNLKSPPVVNFKDKNEPEESHARCHAVDVGPDVDGVALALGEVPGHQ